MKKIIVLITVMALSLVTVTAQDSDDQAYYKDFVKFLKVSGATRNQKVMLKNMFGQFKKMQNIKPKIIDNMEKIMSDEISELNKQLFPIYKKYLSHQDLKEIIKFYESPIGKKLLKSQPMIMKESFQLGVKWGQNVAQRVMKEMKE